MVLIKQHVLAYSDVIIRFPKC